MFLLKKLIYSSTKYSSCSVNEKYSQFWCSYYAEVVTENVYQIAFHISKAHYNSDRWMHMLVWWEKKKKRTKDCSIIVAISFLRAKEKRFDLSVVEIVTIKRKGYTNRLLIHSYAAVFITDQEVLKNVVVVA